MSNVCFGDFLLFLLFDMKKGIQFLKSIYFIVFKKGIPTGLYDIKHTATQELEKLWPSGINIGNNTDEFHTCNLMWKK